eukprot:jgi/Mesvir1/6102/Mv00815-RA.1
MSAADDNKNGEVVVGLGTAENEGPLSPAPPLPVSGTPAANVTPCPVVPIAIAPAARPFVAAGTRSGSNRFGDAGIRLGASRPSILPETSSKPVVSPAIPTPGAITPTTPPPVPATTTLAWTGSVGEATRPGNITAATSRFGGGGLPIVVAKSQPTKAPSLSIGLKSQVPPVVPLAKDYRRLWVRSCQFAAVGLFAILAMLALEIVAELRAISSQTPPHLRTPSGLEREQLLQVQAHRDRLSNELDDLKELRAERERWQRQQEEESRLQVQSHSIRGLWADHEAEMLRRKNHELMAGAAFGSMGASSSSAVGGGGQGHAHEVGGASSQQFPASASHGGPAISGHTSSSVPGNHPSTSSGSAAASGMHGPGRGHGTPPASASIDDFALNVAIDDDKAFTRALHEATGGATPKKIAFPELVELKPPGWETDSRRDVFIAEGASVPTAWRPTDHVRRVSRDGDQAMADQAGDKEWMPSKAGIGADGREDISMDFPDVVADDKEAKPLARDKGKGKEAPPSQADRVARASKYASEKYTSEKYNADKPAQPEGVEDKDAAKPSPATGKGNQPQPVGNRPAGNRPVGNRPSPVAAPPPKRHLFDRFWREPDPDPEPASEEEDGDYGEDSAATATTAASKSASSSSEGLLTRRQERRQRKAAGSAGTEGHHGVKGLLSGLFHHSKPDTVAPKAQVAPKKEEGKKEGGKEVGKKEEGKKFDFVELAYVPKKAEPAKLAKVSLAASSSTSGNGGSSAGSSKDGDALTVSQPKLDKPSVPVGKRGAGGSTPTSSSTSSSLWSSLITSKEDQAMHSWDDVIKAHVSNAAAKSGDGGKNSRKKDFGWRG